MRYLSVCSGIEAATVAWHPLGWEAAAYSEIEAFPRAVLKHHYPDTPLHGDFTTIGADEYGPIDLLVGGTPCQSFSVAGLRGGMDDERGQLALQFLKLLDRTRARWMVWENVPGVLSSNGGRDFGSFLGGLVELGYGFAYRVLDAQHFGVPQRRRRVFVVGHIGDWRRAAAVLFERHSLSGHPAPRTQAGQATAGTLKACAGKSGTPNGAEEADRLIVSADPSHRLNAGGMGRQDYETETLIAFTAKDHGADASDISPTLRSGSHSGSHANGGVMPAVAFTGSREIAGALTSNYGKQPDSSDTNLGPTLAVAAIAETMYGVSHADAAQTYPDQALRALRDAVGEKAYSEWCLGILAAFRTPEVLQSAVHGSGFRRPTDKRNELGDDALPRSEDHRGGAMLTLWQAASDGCSPRGWQPPEQLAVELVAHLSKLPHQRASAQRFLLGLWRAGEGLGLLREALSALQEAWRPAHGEDQPARLNSAVRRLTPVECERLMGFPDDYTAVPYRGKRAADGPRYKALGNSMAVPVMSWIGSRIAQVEALQMLSEAA